MKALWSVFIMIVLVAALPAKDVTVIVDGRSTAYAESKAREIALADALREAVRQGAGTKVASLTGTEDFTTGYDLVFTRAFGFVRNYEILSQGYGKDDGIYRVKLKATVSDTDSFSSQQDILKMLVQRKQSPRVAIQTEVKGVDKGVDVRGVLKEAALAYQLEVVDLDVAANANTRRAERDALTEDVTNAAARKATVSLPYDVLIRARVTVSPGAPAKTYNLTMNRFGVAAELSAVWADTGETIAELTPPKAAMTTTIDNAAGATDCVSRYLRGEVPDTKGASAKDLLRRLIVAWMTELDLGRTIQLELKGVTEDQFNKLTKVLSEEAGIGKVYQREFDAQLISKLELESRLDTKQLSEIITSALPKHQLDQRTSGYILVVPKEMTVATTLQRIIPNAAASNDDKGASPWRWPLIVGGIIAVVGGIILLRKPKPNGQVAKT